MQWHSNDNKSVYKNNPGVALRKASLPDFDQQNRYKQLATKALRNIIRFLNQTLKSSNNFIPKKSF